jgi:hypothetical protein
MAKKKLTSTPLLKILLPDSVLRHEVRDGMGAVEADHRRDYFHDDVKPHFLDSLDIDGTLAKGRESQNRWDYLLSHAPSKSVIAVEPHSAKQEEISVVIRKKDSAKEQLSDHLVAGAKIAKWIWVSSGRNGFADTEKVRRQLDQRGIEFVSPMILLKHLPTTPAATAQRGKRR